MSTTNFPEKAQRSVYAFVRAGLEPTDDNSAFTLVEVYVVSFAYVLGSWKALVSTSLPDGMYYEVTYNPAKQVTYITSYKQWQHVTVPDEPSS